MLLYSVPISPFAARARLALRRKGVSCDHVAPPGGTRSPEYLAINPVGKIPALETPDAGVIAESETIIDYLDEHYPDPPFLPREAAARAQVRNAVRTLEIYATPSLFRLFAQLDPATRDEALIEAEWTRMIDGLRLTAGFISPGAYAVGDAFTKADCMIAPTLQLIGMIAQLLGRPNPIHAEERLRAYEERARQDTDIAACWDEVAAAFATSLQ